MAENVNVPKVGPVNRKAVLIIGGGGVLYVAWRWYQQRSAAQAVADDGAVTDDGFGDVGAIPSVTGAYTGQEVGLPDDSSTTGTDAYGFHGTTNSQWTQYAASQLSQSDDWSYTAVLAALGAYLAGRPLTTAQVQIVQAAIAVAGQPPEGYHVLVPGGDAPITIAPSGVTAKGIGTTSVQVSWSPVAGAAGYHLYMAGGNLIVGESTSTTGVVGNLQPGHTYSLQVAAHTGSGQTGPKSGVVKATTLHQTGPVASGETAVKIK